MKGLITRTVKEYTITASKLVKDGENWKEIELPEFKTCEASETYERFLNKHYGVKEGEKLVFSRTETGKLIGMPLDYFIDHAYDIVDGKLVMDKENEKVEE